MTGKILYTAVTRAKKAVTLIGSFDTLSKSLQKTTERTDELSSALMAAVAHFDGCPAEGH